jgi:hypothetical protein
MLLGVSPTADVGIPGLGQATVAIMRSPDFIPHLLRATEVGSIGSGTSVNVYGDVLRELSQDATLWGVEAGMPGGYGQAIQHVVQQTIEEHPVTGVSPHVHWCVVSRRGIAIGTSDHSRCSASGEWTEWRMPPVARSWPEFLTMVQAAGGDASAATC